MDKESKSKPRLSKEEVLAIYNRLKKSELNDGEECHFILEYVIREADYAKWFSVMGRDIKTGKRVVLPIRNNVVDEFVKEHWGEYCLPGELDQWNLYPELAVYEVPMIWKENKERYIVPHQCLSADKWEILDEAMKGIAEESRKLSLDEWMKRNITVIDE
jgi:hypothetical protein